MMRLLIALFVMLMAAPAMAQDGPVFVPTSAWLVGSASLAPAQAGMKLPCIMANQYDNGFGFRFSGTGTEIMAIAIDFRQMAFKPGSYYKISLGLGPEFTQEFTALAHDPATLIINTQAAPGLQGFLADGRALRLTVGGKSLDFSLLGVEDGLARMAACYSPAAPQDARIMVPPAMRAVPQNALPQLAPPPGAAAKVNGPG